MRRSHLFTDIFMTTKAGISPHGYSLADMAIVASFGVWFVQHVANQATTVAPMWVVTCATVFHLGGEIGMFLFDQLRRVAVVTETIGCLDEQG